MHNPWPGMQLGLNKYWLFYYIANVISRPLATYPASSLERWPRLAPMSGNLVTCTTRPTGTQRALAMSKAHEGTLGQEVKRKEIPGELGG